MYKFKNKSVINATHNYVVLLRSSGNRARNTLSQLAANLSYLNLSAVPASRVVRHAVTLVTIAATRSSCHQSVPVPAASAHYSLFRGVSQKCLLRLGTNIGDPDVILYQQRITIQPPPSNREKYR